MGGRLHYTLVIVEICLWDAGRVALSCFPLGKAAQQMQQVSTKDEGR